MIGNFTIVDGCLKLKTDDGNYIFGFDAVVNTYVFDAEVSSDMVFRYDRQLRI